MNNSIKFVVIFLSISFLVTGFTSVYSADDMMGNGTWDDNMMDDKMMKDSMDNSMKDNMMSSHMKSPLKQIKEGIEPQKVQCRESFQLVFKAADWSPACVKNSSVERLIAMGWAADHDSTQAMMGENMMKDDMMGSKMDNSMTDEKMMNEKESMMMPIGGIDISMAGPVEGSADAPVTIIEFGDYQCPKCDQWFLKEKPTVTKDLLDTGKAKLYFIDFAFFGNDSVSAAQAAYCAGDQGMYHEYHSILYSNQGGINAGWASPTKLKDFASKIGLDTDMFNKCLDSGKYSDRVSYNKEVGISAGVKGTPTFFIVGADGSTERIDGPQPAAIFTSTISKLS